MQANTRAAFLMMASMAAFTLNDTCVKLTGGALPLFQLVTLRGILASLLIYALARSLGALRFNLSRHDWALVALRGTSEAGATYFFLTALLNMPLANVSAVLQGLPLTVTLGAALFFGERVGWQRIVAIAIGFAGMLLIVRPGPDGFSIYSLYALGAVACVTLRDLLTRHMSAEVPSMTVTLVSSLSVLGFAAVSSTQVTWVPVNAWLALLLCGSALFIIGGYLFSIMVMRAGEVSFTAPFRYTGLVWALALGWLVFDHWPDGLTLIGAGIVVGSGLFALYRERVVKRAVADV
ncbi:DMT family transporter [Arenibacterium sp. CAU 1754]